MNRHTKAFQQREEMLRERDQAEVARYQAKHEEWKRGQDAHNAVMTRPLRSSSNDGSSALPWLALALLASCLIILV